MQVIASLLSLQMKANTDQRAVEAFKECQNRIEAMAMIHDNLYHSQSLAQIDFGEYIQELAYQLIESYNVNTASVCLRMDIDDNASLGIDTAIPCGLILNELVSNALKYAFPDCTAGEIYIGLHRDDGDGVTLTVSDNGVGLPKGVDFWDSESLGFQIVKLLTGQLGGTLLLHCNAGTEFKLRFAGV